jgi:hypothetical protein
MRALLVAVAGLLAGCGAAPTNGQACDAQARALCDRLDDCSPHTIAVRYGDLFGCQSGERQRCLERLAAPGTSETASFAGGCALALPSESCLSLFGNTPVLACVAPPGLLHDGDPCLAHGQCRSGTCNLAPGATTGSCGAPAQADESCAARSCARGLVCVDPGAACARPGIQDAACDAAHPCAIGFSCVGAGAQPGSCQPAIAMPGAACDPTATFSSNCDLDLQLVCDPAAGVCVVE